MNHAIISLLIQLGCNISIQLILDASLTSLLIQLARNVSIDTTGTDRVNTIRTERWETRPNPQQLWQSQEAEVDASLERDKYGDPMWGTTVRRCSKAR